jgi:hypothetical protein
MCKHSGCIVACMQGNGYHPVYRGGCKWVLFVCIQQYLVEGVGVVGKGRGKGFARPMMMWTLWTTHKLGGYGG